MWIILVASLLHGLFYPNTIIMIIGYSKSMSPCLFCWYIVNMLCVICNQRSPEISNCIFYRCINFPCCCTRKIYTTTISTNAILYNGRFWTVKMPPIVCNESDIPPCHRQPPDHLPPPFVNCHRLGTARSTHSVLDERRPPSGLNS